MKIGVRIWLGLALGSVLGVAISATPVFAQMDTKTGPAKLQVDNLETPLGIDDPAPSFSWQLDDPARGACQTAYEVSVASQPEGATEGKADVWSSGHVSSSQSLNVRYAGPVLKASTRYWWSVKVWGADGKPYSASAASWFETGLMSQESWKAQWIGFETPEEAAVRHAGAAWIASPDPQALTTAKGEESRIAYRTEVRLEKAVKAATLYATGQDTVAAWVNGKQALEAAPFPPWHQMPWKKFVRADVTADLKEGANALAIQTVRYTTTNQDAAPPMSATLYVQYDDGTTATFASQPGWKCAVEAAQGWVQAGFDDSGWKAAEPWKQAPGPNNPPLGHPWIPDSVKTIGRTFGVKQPGPADPIKSVRLYATALGAYEMFINGKRVSEDVLAPGWTDYREHVKYQTYDVTRLVNKGANTIWALLAPGWYATPLEWFQQGNNYGDAPPALRAELRIEYADGQAEWLSTDSTWQAQSSYITSSEIYDGERQDGRLKQQPRWGAGGSFGEIQWNDVVAIEPRPIQIEAQDFQPIRMEREMPAKTMSEPKPGVYVFDFGQNLAGVERLRVSGPEGTDVRVRFSEILNDDGTLYTENLRTAKATDHFILAGNGVEEFTPQFTFHGFRYAEIAGLPSAPGKDALTAEVIHTNASFAAQLKTGSPMVNQLWSNIVWGQRSNFVGVPTDCPQRDERLGWMADAQVFWRTASYSMDLAAFSRKFGADMRGTQVGTALYGIYSPGTVKENAGWGAGWSDAGVIIPWTSWLQTGDTRVIDENWDGMTKYVAAIETANPDGLWEKQQGIPFGDWLSPEGKTNQTLIATAEWAYDVTLLRQMAHATGRTADEQRFNELFEKIRGAFQKKFVHDDGFVEGADRGPSQFGERTKPAEGTAGDTQTGYVLALHMNLLPDGLRNRSAQKLVDKIQANHGLLATGFLGTPYLLEELSKTGHSDLAYQLLLNTQYPSWGYLIEHGATTTWERWNGDQMKSDPSMNSYNHYAYGAVADWIYRYAAGVDTTPLDAGFHIVVLHPTFDARLGAVDFTYPSAYGVIRSAWKVESGTAAWHITIPANTTGWISDAEYSASHLKPAPADDSGITAAQGPDGEKGVNLMAGTYEFKAELK
jgi:alpha-L-rhamnosidase